MWPGKPFETVTVMKGCTNKITGFVKSILWTLIN